MRKLALIMSTFGFIAFAGMARADQKTESTDKTESGTTLGGKHKTTRKKTVERADGSSTETKVETTRPKADDRNDVADRRDTDKRDVRSDDDKRDVRNVRDDDTKRDVERHDNGLEQKTEHHTTLTGKKQTKTTKKVDNADGSQTETTTTTTEGKHENK